MRIGPPTFRPEILPLKRPRTVRTTWVEAPGSLASLNDCLSQAELLGDEAGAHRDPDPPDRLGLPIGAGDGIGIGLHPNFYRSPFRDAVGPGMTHAGLHLLQHIVPLPDLPAVHRDN